MRATGRNGCETDTKPLNELARAKNSIKTLKRGLAEVFIKRSYWACRKARKGQQVIWDKFVTQASVQAAGINKLSVPSASAFADPAEPEIFIDIGVAREYEATQDILARIEGCHDEEDVRQPFLCWNRDVKSLSSSSRDKAKRHVASVRPWQALQSPSEALPVRVQRERAHAAFAN